MKKLNPAIKVSDVGHLWRGWVHSLRFRLTAWFTGVLALLLLLLAGLLLFEAWQTLRVETDAFLTREAQHVTSLDSSGLGPAEESFTLAHVIDSYQPAPAHKHRHHHAKGLLVFGAVYVRLLSATDKKVILTSPSLSNERVLVSALDTIKLPAAGETAPQFFFAAPNEEQSMRVLMQAVQVGQQPMVLQIAVPWDHNADVLERLLATVLPLVLLAAASGGWILVGRTLRPIQRIVTEAEKLDVNEPPKELLPAPAETDSEIGHLVVTLNSMTTRLHQAFQAQRVFAEAQQRFAADSSHELRTPLTILRGEMELALSRPRSPEAYQATLASGIEEIIRMSQIVEGLSFLARHDASQLQSRGTYTALDLSSLVDRVLADFEAQAREKQVSLCCRAELRPAFVQADATQLWQLLGNLVENAVKYTPAGGSVTVVLAEERAVSGKVERYLVRIEDTGIGIDEEDLPHIFDRFWRADPARTSGGSGLGLAICAQIAQLHKNEIRVKSKVGSGTTVEFTLPAMTAET
ncbi:MAG: sensor histidine kinase [Janthinobacterium lividum]